jgi:hypothetical protein
MTINLKCCPKSFEGLGVAFFFNKWPIWGFWLLAVTIAHILRSNQVGTMGCRLNGSYFRFESTLDISRHNLRLPIVWLQLVCGILTTESPFLIWCRVVYIFKASNLTFINSIWMAESCFELLLLGLLYFIHWLNQLWNAQSFYFYFQNVLLHVFIFIDWWWFLQRVLLYQWLEDSLK